MVPEIWSATDIVFFAILARFLPFYSPIDPENQNFEKIKKKSWRYYHFTNVYHKWQSYDVLFLRYGVQQTEFFVILDHFLPFYSPNNSKNQNFQKTKKMPGDIIILRYYHYHCNINDNHMMYGSWDMKHNGQNFLSFWTVFCPFIPLKKQKIKILKKWKQIPEILSFYTCVP